jgi:hypothetical protein
MRENFYIIYDADEEEDSPNMETAWADDSIEAPKAMVSEKRPRKAKGGPSPDYAKTGLERRRRAVEANERRRLLKVSAAKEKALSIDEGRRVREAEYARRLKEYNKEKELLKKQKQAQKAAREAAKNARRNQ